MTAASCLSDLLMFMLGFLTALYAERWCKMAVSLGKQVYRRLNKHVSD